MSAEASIDRLMSAWMSAKEAERAAVEKRREVEDALIELLGIVTTEESSKTIKESNFKAKIAVKMNRRIDGDALQEIAAEHGLSDHLSTLFRWKPEIVMKAWKSADQSITAPLLGAITTTPGRPSFSIEMTEEQ
jgi:hypothetical protein